MRAMERVPRKFNDRFRYARDRLLELHDACTQLPEELQSSDLECLTVSALELELRARIEKNRRYETHNRSNSSAQALTAPAIEKTANAWMNDGGAQSEKKKLKVYCNVKAILNNLTPEKYDVLAEQIMLPGISSREVLPGVISLIFDKALLEPVLCAKLCVHLSKKLPEFPVEQAGDKPITFQRVLLNTCQEVFEGADAMREEIKKLSKPEQAAERDEQQKRVKLRTLGNISLIGELIQELLGQDPKAIPAEENVEALCHLFTTVAMQLEESTKSTMAFDTYFARLKVIGESRALPSRIRFMVRDILDMMRSNKWVPRREEMKAKTINEILADAEAKSGLRPGMKALRIGRAVAKVGGRRKDSTGVLPTPGLLPIPGSGGFGGMGGAMAGGGSQARFSSTAMRAGGMGARALPQGSSGYGFMGKRSDLPGSGSPKPVPEPVKVPEPAREVARPAPAAAAAAAAGAPSADLPKKSESLVKEYLSVVDLKEAVLCVQELKNPGFHPELVRVAMATALDMRERECSLVLKLLLHLHAEGVISTSDVRGGVSLVAEGLQDMAMDAPLAPKGLGGMLAGLVLGGAAELQVVQEVAVKVEDECLQKAVMKGFVEKLKESEAEELGEVCGRASVDKEVLLSVAVASDLSEVLALGDCRATVVARDNFAKKDDFNLRGLLHRVQMFGK